MTKLKTKSDVYDVSLGGLIQAYLMTSHLYYQRFESVVEDEVYDRICKRLLNNFEDLPQDHPHIEYIDEDALRAGTAYHIKEYPIVVEIAADMWLREEPIPELGERGK